MRRSGRVGGWHAPAKVGAGLALGLVLAACRFESPVAPPQAPGAGVPPAAPHGTPAAQTPHRPDVPAADAPAPGLPAGTPVDPAGQARLLVPVEGVSPEVLSDTFADARSEGRVHDAIDIMAPAGTPVLAVADGTIEKLFDSQRGGITLYQFNPARTHAYYYAHLQGYADGIAEGQQLRRGQRIGYVGATGNASADAPHLHFAVFVLGPEQQWWKGEAVNPYPLLRDSR